MSEYHAFRVVNASLVRRKLGRFVAPCRDTSFFALFNYIYGMHDERVVPHDQTKPSNRRRPAGLPT